MSGSSLSPEDLAERLKRDFALMPVVATEIEFYLHGADSKLPAEEIIALIREECGEDIPLASAEKERGPDQYEVALVPEKDVLRAARDTERFKTLMKAVFAAQGIEADFSAKPLPDAPGSGLHVHVHLEDANGKNVFFREEDEAFSPMLLYAIGGLLALMNPCMPIFAPMEESYARFVRGSNAPTTVSWGPNNRSVAIRLPTKPMEHKHIEHRVAGSDANVSKVIAAILAGVHFGLTHKRDPGKPTYGDAAHPQYALPLLAQNLRDAQQYMAGSEAVEEYLSRA